MFIINDIELLEKLSKHKMLGYLVQRCAIAVSGIRLNHYSLRIRQVINGLSGVTVMNVEKENFDAWIEGKRKFLSLSDLSSIYLVHCNQGATLIMSPEDDVLITEVKINKIKHKQFDDFIIEMIKDEKIIQLYNLIKVA